MGFEQSKEPVGPDKNLGRKGRWAAFVFTLLLMFWGIHLMIHSVHSWIWFVPMLLPFLGVVQMESEEPEPLGNRDEAKNGLGRLTKTLGNWSAWVVAFIGIALMVESSVTWYWLTPMLVPVLILLPGEMKKWERQSEEKKRRKADKKKLRAAGKMTAPLSKLIKIAFWLGVLWVVWYIGSYYVLVALLG